MRTETLDARARGKARRPKFKRGKALQRLLYFGSQRQASINKEAVAASHAPKSAIPKWAVTGAAELQRPTRGSAKTAIRSTESVAKTYANTARSLTRSRPRASRGAAPAAPSAASAWQSIGPDVIKNGQTYGNSRVDVSGRVSAIAVDPADTKHVLCGSAGGGIWESRDGGGSWQQRTDAMPTLTIGAVAFDPGDSKKVYAGSGEGNFYASLGAGVYSSSDGGTTWKVLGEWPLRRQGLL